MNWNPETTPNFTPEELGCKCGHCDGSAHMQQSFMMLLQEMRNILGYGLPMNSGYRCSLHPEEVEKEQPGAHNQGTAGDIKVSGAKMRYEVIKAAIEVGMVGLGVANGFVHVDSGHLYVERPAAWKY